MSTDYIDGHFSPMMMVSHIVEDEALSEKAAEHLATCSECATQHAHLRRLETDQLAAVILLLALRKPA